MSEQATGDRRSWFPLVLAAGFVVFALTIAFLAYAANRTGDPSKASTVDDVAGLTVEAVEGSDPDLYAELLCGQVPDDPLEPYTADSTAHAEATDVRGSATGTFRVTIHGAESAELAVTVGREGTRSCIERVTVSR